MPDTYSHYSRTVESYSRYRPRYPQTLIGWLTAEVELAAYPHQPRSHRRSHHHPRTELYCDAGVKGELL